MNGGGDPAARRGTLTHADPSGTARMVDVGDKAVTERSATARGTITMTHETLALVQANALAKGDVLGVARIAGVMAAKRTPELIPLCHHVPLTHVDVALVPDPELPGVVCEATARAVGRTGVEMEAIVAVTVALVTVYDMAKSADRAMRIGDVALVEKRGGASGGYRAGAAPSA